MDQIKIGRFLSEVRRERKLTQEELAEKLRVNVKSVSRWETGVSLPDYSILKDLCDTLGITVNDFLSGCIIDHKETKKYDENVYNLLDSFKRKLKRHWLIIITIIVLIYVLLWGINIFIDNYRVLEDYNSKVFSIEENDGKLMFKSYSNANINYKVIKYKGEYICFLNNGYYLYNKLPVDKKSTGYVSMDKLDRYNHIKIYYTNKSVKKIKKMNEEEIQGMINKSFLMYSK